MEKISSQIIAIGLAFLLSTPAYAGFVKMTLSYISKWEVISSYKVVGYVGETPYIIAAFDGCPSLQVGGNFILRTFSPSIQGGDTVIVNGQSCSVSYVEGIRQN